MAEWTASTSMRGTESYHKGTWSVLKIDRAWRPWFAVHSLTMLSDKRGDVRFFGSAKAAMKAAEQAAKK